MLWSKKTLCNKWMEQIKALKLLHRKKTINKMKKTYRMGENILQAILFDNVLISKIYKHTIQYHKPITQSIG